MDVPSRGNVRGPRKGDDAMTLTKTHKVLITVGGGAVGGILGFVLTNASRSTPRERVLTTILTATAGVGVAQTAINLTEMV